MASSIFDGSRIASKDISGFPEDLRVVLLRHEACCMHRCQVLECLKIESVSKVEDELEPRGFSML